MVTLGILRHEGISRALWPVAVAVLATALACSPGAAAEGGPGVVDHTMREARVPPRADRPITSKYRYLFSPTARWAGPLHWRYNHANAPPLLADSSAAIVTQLRSALDKWTAQCGITYVYDGETTASPKSFVNDPDYGPQPDGLSVVGWGALDASLGGWTDDWYVENDGGRILVDADMTLNVTRVVSVDQLDGLATHEWGHAMGLSHSNVEAALMAGPPLTRYNELATPQPDDVRGCRCQYGLPPGVLAPYVCSLPDQIDFGNIETGTVSAVRNVAFTNSGNAPLSILASTVENAQFSHVAGCVPGTLVAPGATCTLQVRATPGTTGVIAGRLTLFTIDGDYQMPLQATGMQASGDLARTVEVVEFYNASLRHYFITWNEGEIANLDAGMTPTRWTRTGQTFKAYATAQPTTSQVCRLYIPPREGDSHFFGRSPAECSATELSHPDFMLEDPSFMQLQLPMAGACLPGAQPIYRLFNDRVDVNHRYVTDRNIRDQMVAAGWLAEGDGPDLVAMCAAP